MLTYSLEDKVQLKDFIVDRALRAIKQNNLEDFKTFIKNEVRTHKMLSQKEMGYITKASIKLVSNQLNSEKLNDCST